MKKQYRNYVIFWAVLLALFNVIAFVSVGWKGVEKYTASFWIGYVFITLSFIGQLFCSKLAFDVDNSKKTFYRISYVTTSYSGLIVSFIVGGFCMINSVLPYWIGIIVCSIILSINVIDVLKVRVDVTEIERVDEKVQTQTFFIKSLTIDAEKLVNSAKSAETKKACQKVYEAARYSIKMSTINSTSIESEIAATLSEFADAVATEDSSVEELSKKLVVLLEDRNNKCKLMK